LLGLLFEQLGNKKETGVFVLGVDQSFVQFGNDFD